MKPKKMDLFNLESLLESAKVAEKISEGMVDESVYNVLSREGSLFESLEGTEIKTILENGSEIKTNMPDVEELEADIKKAFGLLESEFSNVDYTELKGKTVFIKNNEGREFKVKVLDANDSGVLLQGLNGGPSTRMPNSKFREHYVSTRLESESTKGITEMTPDKTGVVKPKEDMGKQTKVDVTDGEVKTNKEVVMEANKEVKPTVVESGDKKDNAKLGDGIDGTDPALGKEESPVKGDKKVVENPTGKLTTEHVVEFKHQSPVEHTAFVSAALSAKKDAQPKSQPKLPKNNIETKLLEHGAKFESFVKSFKTPETQELLECILEGYGVCLEAQKKLINKVSKKDQKDK